MGSGLSDPIPMRPCTRSDLGIAFSGTLDDDTIVYKDEKNETRTW